MTEVSRFWTGTTPGDAGPYSADNFSDWALNCFLASKAESGPLQGTGTSPDIGLTVQQTGVASANVQVQPGNALVAGHMYELTGTPPTLAIAPNGSGNPRIDTIILRADWTLQTVRLAVLQGTPNAIPVAPTLTQTFGTRWEIPLADIAVANGFATIVTANITPRRAWANVGGNIYLLDILNNSGGLLQAGDVVVWDTTADRGVKSSTTLGDPTVAGVWQSRTAAAAYGRLLVKGIGPVNTTAAVSRGNVLIQSGTAKQASVPAANVSNFSAFAYALIASAGAGLVDCYVDVGINMYRLVASQSLIRQGVANYSSSSTTFVDVDAVNLILTVTIVTGRALFEAFFQGSIGTGGNGEFDVILDSTTRLGGADGSCLTGSASLGGLAIVGRFTGLTIGQHTFKLQYRNTVGGADTVVMGNNPSPIMMRVTET